MGASGSSETYTDIDYVSGTLRPLEAQCPRVAYEGPGVLKIVGYGGVYNTAPPLQESWLGGHLTPAEFTAIVRHVNDSTSQGYIGLRKTFPTAELPARNRRIFEFNQQAVAAMNEAFNSKGVRVSLDEGQATSRVTGVRDGSVTSSVHRKEFILFITVPSTDVNGWAPVVK